MRRLKAHQLSGGLDRTEVIDTCQENRCVQRE